MKLRKRNQGPAWRVAPYGYMHGAYAVLDSAGLVVDIFRSESGAQYARRLLEAGAGIDTHAVYGCRVVIA